MTSQELARILRKLGCELLRQGKGSHQVWRCGDIHEEYGLPRKVMASLKRYQVAQEKLRRDAEEATQAERSVAQVLAALGISRRDAGDLLGLSGARIQQVLNGT